jgi:hypothetical protein
MKSFNATMLILLAFMCFPASGKEHDNQEIKPLDASLSMVARRDSHRRGETD